LAGREVAPFVQLVECREDLRQVHRVVVGAVVLEPAIEQTRPLGRDELTVRSRAQCDDIGVPSAPEGVHVCQSARMSADSRRGDTLDSVRRAGVETTGIEIIDEADRTARPADLFWPWFAANVSVFGISY